MVNLEILKEMSAKEVLELISNDLPELSQHKILAQRNEYIRLAKTWIELNESKTADVA